jgi:hypothetical protein
VNFPKGGAFAADRRRRESAVSSTCEPPGREATRMRRTATSVSVTAADGAVVTCSVPGGTDLSQFPLGTSAKMHCHRIAAGFRLEYLKSEHAVIEIER